MLLDFKFAKLDLCTVLEIAANHWPFTYDQIQDFADRHCTFSMGQQSLTCKMSNLQKNGD